MTPAAGHGPDSVVRKPAVLHGRRAGRPLRKAQREALDGILPHLAVDRGHLSQPLAMFPAGTVELRLEIGFGGGEHLAACAERRPEVGFLGCEPFRSGVAKLVRRIEETGLANVRIHPGDAGEIVAGLPEASLERVDILYPDPWPKRRQRKRRFISAEALVALARVLRPGAELRFATDIDDYAGWVLSRILRSADFAWDAEGAADWLEPWPHWPSTRYEAKALRQGRRPVYLTFRRRS